MRWTATVTFLAVLAFGPCLEGGPGSGPDARQAAREGRQDVRAELARLHAQIRTQRAAAAAGDALPGEPLSGRLAGLERRVGQLGPRSAREETRRLQALGDEARRAGLATATGSQRPPLSADVAYAGGSGAITGTVRDTVGTALAGVDVDVYLADCTDLLTYVTTVTTDVTGAYVASGLASGSYHVVTGNALTLGNVDAAYGGFQCLGICFPWTPSEAGTPIVVTDPVTTSGVDLALAFGGGFSGTVTEGVTGVPDVAVEVYDSAGAYLGEAWTDVNGAFTVVGLPTGTYYARAGFNWDGYLGELFNNVACPYEYPTCQIASGTPIGVVSGVVVPGIDFDLTPGGGISGTVTTGGLAAANIELGIYDPSGELVASAFADGVGDYVTDSGLPAGQYYVRTFDDFAVNELYGNVPCSLWASCSLAGATAVTVPAGSDVTGIDFALDAGGQVSGTVTLTGTGAALDADVYVFDAAGTLWAYTVADSFSSGAYLTDENLPAGTYYVIALGYTGEIPLLYGGGACGVQVLPEPAAPACPVTGGTGVVVALGSETQNVNLVMSRGSFLTGTVSDFGTGLGLAQADVWVYDSAGNYFTSSWIPGACGAYSSLDTLPAGTYHALAFSYGDDYRDELYNNVDCGIGCTVTSGAAIGADGTTATSGVDFALERFVRRQDVNQDWASDILWRNSGGAFYVWMMDGTALQASTYLAPISANWLVKAIADFNGDGEADILWRDSGSGATYVWFMSGSTVIGSGYTAGQATTAWTISDVGDLNGDGRADIVWRESAGAVYLWLMDGLSLAPGTAYLPPIPLAWQVKGVGDFDGDGLQDILWRETASGATYIWFMDGSSVVGQGYTSGLGDTTWTIQGVGDLDGDGRDDIVWRQDTGALYLWLMEGLTLGPGTAYLPPISLAWQVRGIRDFDQDGRSDILWRETGAGSTYVWFMDGATTTGAGYTTAQATTDWTVQAP